MVWEGEGRIKDSVDQQENLSIWIYYNDWSLIDNFVFRLEASQDNHKRECRKEAGFLRWSEWMVLDKKKCQSDSPQSGDSSFEKHKGEAESPLRIESSEWKWVRSPHFSQERRPLQKGRWVRQLFDLRVEGVNSHYVCALFDHPALSPCLTSERSGELKRAQCGRTVFTQRRGENSKNIRKERSSTRRETVFEGASNKHE